jgi:hypothetical protein
MCCWPHSVLRVFLKKHHHKFATNLRQHAEAQDAMSRLDTTHSALRDTDIYFTAGAQAASGVARSTPAISV